MSFVVRDWKQTLVAGVIAGCDTLTFNVDMQYYHLLKLPINIRKITVFVIAATKFYLVSPRQQQDTSINTHQTGQRKRHQ